MMTEAAAVVHGNFAIEIFDPNVTNWKRWLRRFEGAVTVFKVPEGQKVAYLLHFIGTVSFDMICDKLAPVDPYTKSYAFLTEKLEEFYAPAPLEIAENYRFHQRKQEEGEKIQQFVAALHKLSINCNFGQYLQTALRNQLVFGLSSKRAQSRLLETKDLTFEKAVEMARAMELSEKDVDQFQTGPASVAAINQKVTQPSKKNGQPVLKKKTTGKSNTYTNRRRSENHSPFANGSDSNIVCFRCGGKHLATSCTLDRNISCRNCGIKGHLQKVCKRKNKVAANELGEILLTQTKQTRYREKFYTTVTLEGKQVQFEIDSGAAVTIVSKQFAKSCCSGLRMERSDLQLITYCKTSIPVIGFVRVRVQYNNITKTLNMYITNIDREPLMGREWIRQFNVQLAETLDIESVNISQEIKNMLQDYTKSLDSSYTKIKKIQARLAIRDDTRPIFCRARKVPFKLMPLVEKEIEKLVDRGILIKTNTSAWATPVVPVLKKDGTVRLCGDFSMTLNKHLLVDEHPLPTIDELFYTVAGGDKFSKIDLKQAYLQMEVHPEDQEMLTLNTHRGLYKCTRLLYGIASAPAIWQREIENILKDIPGVAVFLDDIKISGPTDTIHLQRLKQVLNRLSEYNVQINADKCEFFKTGIHYCGHYIDKNGIHKEKAKIEAIENMRRPTNTTELRAFLGMINYYGRFIPNVSTILKPLYNLLEGKQGKKLRFEWSSACEAAFHNAKKAFMSDKILAHYNPKLPLIVACDASAYGVGAVLSQKQPDGTERVIQYASQLLTRTQRKYAQIDKKAYAIIFAIKKFYQYLFGNHFVLYTDHRPLIQIFAPGKGLPAHSALRMQHYAVFLQGFSYEIKYKNTKQHSNADGLSRLPITKEEDYEQDIVDNFEISIIDSLPITHSELAAETEKDSELQALLRGLQEGNSTKPSERFNIPLDEFSYQKGIIVRDCRVIIPKKFRNRILQELHSEHPGIVKMKASARQYVWWPRIDHDLEEIVRNCTNCNLVRNNPRETKTYEWESAKFPFQRVHIDYAGPFMGHYFFVLVDAFSKWPEVHITKDMTTNTTVQN